MLIITNSYRAITDNDYDNDDENNTQNKDN